MADSDQLPDISIVSTLYNEEGNVASLANNLHAAFAGKFPGKLFEIVLVLNGSEDRTPEIAEQVAKQIEQVKLVKLETNRGYGGGIQAGLAQARGRIVGYVDGDEQITSDAAASVFEVALNGDYDLVKAWRTTRQDGWQRRFVTTTYNALFGIMFGNISRDINAKPKVFSRQALEKLRLTANDWFLDAEIMIQAKRHNFSVKEIPVVFEVRKSGSSNVRVSTMIEFLSNMWQYRNGKK
jgi:glycosyltransferase involved in cell wall biosynthesis